MTWRGSLPTVSYLIQIAVDPLRAMGVLSGGMHWKLYDTDEYDQISGAFLFPWSEGHTIVFAAQDASGALHRLTPSLPAPAEQPVENRQVPCGVYSFEELQSPDAWRALLDMCPAHRIDLATYQAAHPEFPAEALLQASGGKLNFKSLSDWRELGALDEKSAALGRAFDLPLNVLRLWSRLDATERTGWLGLFEAHPFNKNFIRDIVLDLYDLDAARRKTALAAALEHAERWLARETRSRAYPAGEVRDLVRELRSPASASLRRRLLQLRRDLGLPKQMQLEWPVDLEQRQLTLQMEFSDRDGLQALLARAATPEFQSGIQAMLDEL